MSDVIAGRIALLDPLARGASGSLWRAVDRRYGAVCAAKVMRQRDGAEVLRFVREQSVGGAEGLGAHPHLLPPYTWVAEDDTIVLVMPLVHGGTLAGTVAREGALAPPLVSELLRQLLAALAALHVAGWVHRDVKPANLLLGATGTGHPHLLLADFGIALHATDIRLTATGMVAGTPGFMAPEVLAGDLSAAAQDVWAAAACALEALAPGRPGDRPRPEELAARLPELLPAPEGPEATLRETLAALLDDDPTRRPEAARALAMLPAPAGPPEQWLRTAAGAPLTLRDLVDPLPPGTPGHGLPEVPLAGPHGLDRAAPGLHERLSALSAAAATPAPAPASSPAPPPRAPRHRAASPVTPGTPAPVASTPVPSPAEDPDDDPTRRNPAVPDPAGPDPIATPAGDPSAGTGWAITPPTHVHPVGPSSPSGPTDPVVATRAESAGAAPSAPAPVPSRSRRAPALLLLLLGVLALGGSVVLALAAWQGWWLV